MSIVFASVEEYLDVGINYEMSYPIVYTKDKAAQDKINQDIYHYIATFKNDYDAGKFFKGSFSYKVKFEDNDYISLTITDYRYNMRSAHGYSKMYGVVYDKSTGRRLPLSHFLKITLQDLNLVYAPSKVYTEGAYGLNEGDKVTGWDWAPKRISEDYYLLGNGEIALIYQRYEISYGDAGQTSIRLSTEEVDYFNRKNRDL